MRYLLQISCFLFLLASHAKCFSQPLLKEIHPTTDQKTIVLITGSFVHPSVWDHWKNYFESKGYIVVVPVWPNKSGSSMDLRKMQNEPLAEMNLEDVINYYDEVVRSLKAKPILIGHSMGGLIVQKLLERDLGSVGIAIHSVPPKGVLTFKYSFVKSVIKPLGYFSNRKKNYMISFKQWKYSFTNGMPEDDQKSSYLKFAIPESKRVTRGALTKWAKVDYTLKRVPLLILAGSADHLTPASLNLKNFKRYARNKNSITSYKEFNGRNHFVLGQATWKEEADFIISWLHNTGSVKGLSPL